MAFPVKLEDLFHLFGESFNVSFKTQFLCTYYVLGTLYVLRSSTSVPAKMGPTVPPPPCTLADLPCRSSWFSKFVFYSQLHRRRNRAKMTTPTFQMEKRKP